MKKGIASAGPLALCVVFGFSCIDQTGDILRRKPVSKEGDVLDAGSSPEDGASIQSYSVCNSKCSTPGVCATPCWRWMNPLPSGFDLRAAFGLSDTEVFMVGENGVILHLQDFTVSGVPSPTRATLRGIWGSGPDNFWIVGDAGTILHGDGNRFDLLPPPTANNLNGVSGLARDDVWIGGDFGTILHFDGSVWMPISSPTGASITGVYQSGPQDVWFAASGGPPLHFDGTMLSPITVISGLQNSVAVGGSGPSDVWFTGSEVWHFDGKNFNPGPAPGGAYKAVAPAGPGSVWSSDSNGMIRFQGSSYRTVPAYQARPGLVPAGLWARTNADTGVWLVGSAGYAAWLSSDMTGVSVRTRYAADGSALVAMWAASASDLWAVGAAGVILRWNGDSLTRIESGTTEPLRNVWGSAKDDVWIVGGTDSTQWVQHWDGTGLRTLLGGSGAGIAGVWGSSRDDIWMGDMNGGLWHWDGLTLSVTPFHAGWEIIGLSGTRKDDVWGIGRGGFMHYDGASWSVRDPYFSNTINCLWAIAPDDVWVGGTGGMLAHFDGRDFTLAPSDVNRTNIVSIWGRNASDVWAVANYPSSDIPREILFHYDGTAWTETGSGLQRPMQKIYGSDGAVWVSGSGGSLLSLTR